MRIEQVDPKEMAAFRHMVEAYWQELMPHAVVLRDPRQWEAYFQAQFAWDGGNRHPCWATVGGERVGFLSLDLYEEERRAQINHFYIVPEQRRRGYGTAMVAWIFFYLDGLGVERIDLNVRRDNPSALAFWQAQGFGIAGYRLRQYRDPEKGTAFVGALSSDLASTAPPPGDGEIEETLGGLA